MLLESQQEWSSKIGELTRAEIDRGMEILKTKMEKDDDLKWPDIATTLRFCKANRPKPVAALEFKPAAEMLLTDELRAQREKVGAPKINNIRTMLLAPNKKQAEVAANKAKENAARKKIEAQLLAEAKQRFKTLNQK